MTRKRMCWFLSALVVATVGLKAEAPAQQVAHMVFFTLKEKSDESSEKLVAACQKYLSGHPGTVYFSAGARAHDMQREVNDLEFDVALHIVFRNKEAQDRYQTSERHLKFIEENSHLWERPRVFDSYLARAPRDREGDPEAARRIPLPDPASSFAGMVRAKVVAKRDAGTVVVVEEVLREWEHNRAKNSKALVGKQVLVDIPTEEGRPVEPILRFVRSLKIGETVTLDVAHKKGETLTILELTEEQRDRVEKLPRLEGDRR